MQAADPRFRHLQDLFDRALALSGAQRDDFVDAACADDPDLKDDLSRLLAREQASRFISHDAARIALDHALRAALPQAFVEGRQLGPFRVTESLGGGGMGRVYRAVRSDGAVEQEVAVKLVRADLLNPALLTRFSSERRMLAALDHPNICRFVDAGATAEGAPYVVMECVRGKPLFEYCDQHRLTIEQRLRLLRKILSAVEHAHHNLIIHRDIKSENILVTDAGEPKLLDFGIAKSLSGNVGATSTADRFLTPANAAPEQLLGRPVGVGCDVHALGLLTYELLCGRPPFEFSGLSSGEVERLLLHVPPPPMSQRAREAGLDTARARGLANPDVLVRDLCGDLDAIVSRCLRKAPDERYPSVEQIDNDVTNVLERQPITARKDDRGYRARKFISRHRLSVSLSAGLVGILLAATAVVGWYALSLERQRNVAVLERDRAQQVVALLRQSFVAADPSRAAGADVSVRQVLDAAMPRIEALSQPHPVLYASLASTIAEVELDLFEHDAAGDLAQRAEVALTRADPDPELLQKVLLLQARSFLGLGDLAAAAAVLERLRAGGADRSPGWLLAHGQWLRRSGHDAGDVLQRAVDLTRTWPADDELATQARWSLSRTYADRGRYEAAIAVLDDTIAWQLAGLDADHPRVNLSRLRRIEAFLRAGRALEVLDAARSVFANVVADYGPDSPMAIRAAVTLGQTCARAGQPDEAVDVLENAIATSTRILGQRHPFTVTAERNLATLRPTQTDHR